MRAVSPLRSSLAGSCILVATALSCVISCADLKTAPPGAGNAGEGGNSSSTPGSLAGSGTRPPGTPDPSTSDGGASSTGDAGFASLPEFGILPSGYCCETDAQCRFGHCVDAGDGHPMCMDECHGNGICHRDDISFTCDGSQFKQGLCRPPAGFACLLPSKFVRGTRQPGECCTATGDGSAGSECEGNMCGATGDGPFICTHVCKGPRDCPSGLVCESITDTRKECVPGNSPYTCK